MSACARDSVRDYLVQRAGYKHSLRTRKDPQWNGACIQCSHSSGLWLFRSDAQPKTPVWNYGIQRKPVGDH